ncbi:sterol desaturase family protein [bacterium]|nr:sterol desaturase family protein [bacterium]
MDAGRIFLITSLLGLSALEWLFPRQSHERPSTEVRQNFLLLIVNAFALPSLASFISQKMGPTPILYSLYHSPLWLQFLVTLFLLDFTSYWVHWSFHSIPVLWKLHRVHHSATELTALSSFRHHSLEVFTHMLIQGLLLGVLSISYSVIFYTNLIFLSACMIQHSNIRLWIPRVADWVLITPRNHYWHHSKELHGKYGQNFGFIFSFWDRIFNTLHLPNHYRTEIGVHSSRD